MVGEQLDVLEAAALLHDIGYAPELVLTGFHAIDGAVYLRDVIGADPVIVGLVAHHSCAEVEAEERNLLDSMREFEADGGLLDALTNCDMTTSPDGARVGIDARVAEIESRYAADDVVARAIRRAKPALHACCERWRVG